jgi:hypothetical protein
MEKWFVDFVLELLEVRSKSPLLKNGTEENLKNRFRLESRLENLSVYQLVYSDVKIADSSNITRR